MEKCIAGSSERTEYWPNKVSPLFKKALLAREDSRFFQHHGIDPVGIVRALMRNLVHLGVREGGSTITQQLARNSFTLGGRDLSRKILEAFVACRIESSYSKNQILGFYTDRIYFGSGLYGLETASQAYFGKSSADLTLSEAALLAGLIRSPNRYSPFTNLKGALDQRNEVLDRMAELKMISSSEADAAEESIGAGREPACFYTAGELCDGRALPGVAGSREPG